MHVTHPVNQRGHVSSASSSSSWYDAILSRKWLTAAAVVGWFYFFIEFVLYICVDIPSVDFFFFFLPSVLSFICSLIRHSSFLSLPYFYSYHYFLSFRFKPCLKTDAHHRRRWTVSESTRVKEGLYVGDILFLPRVAPPHAWGQTVSASSWQIPSPTRRSN